MDGWMDKYNSARYTKYSVLYSILFSIIKMPVPVTFYVFYKKKFSKKFEGIMFGRISLVVNLD